MAQTSASISATKSTDVPVKPAVAKEVFSTGVAKGRDRLDAAISTSSLKETEIEKLGARSVAEIVRNIPGVRAEAGNGEGNNNYTIRGLPIAGQGAKYVQFQEDGLPVLEFGDLSFQADNFLRADLMLGQVEAIRGGSASTFASNSPGGVINFISRTGEAEGGAIMLTAGLDHDSKRADFTYGGKINDTLRFNVGGFYRVGEGPRETGFTSQKGGQIKLNVTKQFSNGFIRLSGKYLDDRTPVYPTVPLRVTGTDANPKYESLANFDIRHDALVSPYVANGLVLDGGNQVKQINLQNGMHPVVKSIGLESQFDVAGFTLSEKFRFADISGQSAQFFGAIMLPASTFAAAFGGRGAQLSYATGPNAGQTIADPAGLNGNGLLTMGLQRVEDIHSFDNMTNDFRLTRQEKLGGGELTMTAGFYTSRQSVDMDWIYAATVADVRGGGQEALVDITTAAGGAVTQGGILSYSPQPGSGAYHRKYNVDFAVNAPYGSINYHVGKIAIGASVRYDMGKARGQLFGVDLGGGRVGLTTLDVDGNGTISAPERSVAILPLTQPAPVHVDYHYLSYSTGINYRFADSFAVFARYSLGGRGAGDRVLFSPGVSATTGKLTKSKAGHDTVKQAEIGSKFRKGDLTLNLTGFWAQTQESNSQIVTRADGRLDSVLILRSYRAYGAEFEGGYRRGPFSVTAGATYTHATIADDPLNMAVVGNIPRHQANFMFQATPQIETHRFTVGANVIGTTGSYAQDANQLKIPGFTTVNAFLQYRPVDRVELSLNASNLFDTLALTEVTQAAIPASGIAYGRVITGRTISTSLRISL